MLCICTVVGRGGNKTYSKVLSCMTSSCTDLEDAAPSDYCAYTYIAEVKTAKHEDDVYIFAAVQGRARRNASRKRLESCPNKMKVTFSWNPKDIGTHS